MADSVEELEPLFDYSRVQPLHLVFLDDGDDSSPAFPCKKSKLSVGVEEPKKEEVIQIVEEDQEDEEDWLPPPVKIDPQNLRENSTLKEIRMKKQELESCYQSAEDILRTVDEVAKRDLLNSMQSCADSVPEPQQKAKPERAKIAISIQDKDVLRQIRVFMDDKFEKIFKICADKVKRDVKTLAFCFDGDKISPAATPEGLGMEDDDIIEVHIKSS